MPPYPRAPKFHLNLSTTYDTCIVGDEWPYCKTRTEQKLGRTTPRQRTELGASIHAIDGHASAFENCGFGEHLIAIAKGLR
jgi:hypothetical protein